MARLYGNRMIKAVCTGVFVLSMFVMFAIYDVIVVYREPSQLNDINESEARHIALLKVHKTGSSTVQNIFLRFGTSRNLTFILASATNNDCRGMQNCISFYKTLNDDIIVPPPKNRPFEIMCSHVVYNREQFRKYLPRDTHMVAIVREPVTRLESAIAFFRLMKHTNISKFAKNPFQYDSPKVNNLIAFEFGFKKEWFPNSTYQKYTTADWNSASKYARQISKDFELILLNERMDDSLVLMKRILGWRTQDILYQSKLSRQHDKFSKQDAHKLRTYLYLDYLIYDMALENFEKKVIESGPGFENEVKEFQAVNAKAVDFCARVEEKVLNIKQSKWHGEFNITWDFCSDLFRKEGDYFDIIRLTQYGTLDTY